MFNRILLQFLLVSSLLIHWTCGGLAQSASVSGSNSGVKITLSNISWQNGRLTGTDLGIDFTVTSADGSSMVFADPQQAIIVKSSTDQLLCASPSPTIMASFDDRSKSWHVNIPGVDPREKIIHLQFYVRDPASTSEQSGDLTSDFRFDDVPLPTQNDLTEPLEKSFTTDWGTVATLSGITLESKGRYGQGDVRYDFTFNHSQVSDDSLSLRFVNAFDNGVHIDGMFQTDDRDPVTGDQASVSSAAVPPVTHPSLSFEFTLRESAESKILSAKWTLVSLELPVSRSWPFSSTYEVADQSSAVINNVQYRMTHVKDPPLSKDRFLITMKSFEPKTVFRVVAVAWSPTLISALPQQNLPTLDLFSDIYWNSDHTMIDDDQSSAFVRSNGGPTYFPLLITVQKMKHDNETVSFSRVPVPSPGQTLVVDQQPDRSAFIPIRLRSIAWQTLNEAQNVNLRQMIVPFGLKLTFEYTVTDGSQIGLGVTSSQDSFGNALFTVNSADSFPFFMQTPSPQDNQSVILYSVVPVSGSKALNLKLTLTKDTPAGLPENISISADGKWSLLP